jgi:hypothetical protein
MNDGTVGRVIDPSSVVDDAADDDDDDDDCAVDCNAALILLTPVFGLLLPSGLETVYGCMLLRMLLASAKSVLAFLILPCNIFDWSVA